MNAEFFSEGYLPEVVVNREREKLVITDYLSGVLRGTSFGILYVYGPSGSGKTTVARFVLRQLEDEHPKVLVVYLDCGGLTRYQVLSEVCSRLCGRDERKSTCQERIRRIVGRISSKKVKMVVALDNFDKIRDVESLLWDFHRISQSAIETPGLILISTDEYDLLRIIGKRLYSRLRPTTLNFRRYDAETLKQILRQRIIEAYGRPIASEEALTLIAEFVEENGGNARLLFDIFLKAVENAQNEGENTISDESIKRAIENKREEMIIKILYEIEKENQKMLKALETIAELEKQSSTVYTGLLERAIREKGITISRRSLEYYLKDLKEKGLITLKKTKIGRGYSWKIKLAIPQKLLNTK